MKPKGRTLEQLSGWHKTIPQRDAFADTVDLLDADEKRRAFLAQCYKAAGSLERAAKAFEQARGKENGWEVGAIGYGKLLAYYGLGLVEETDFRMWRKFFGY